MEPHPEQRARRRVNLDQLFLLLAIIIGIVAGAAVVGFRLVVERTSGLLLPENASPLQRVLSPTLTGLLIGFLVIRYFPLARGSGVNQTKSALYVFDGRMPLRSVIGKFITSALAIGSGQSLGPEDPSLQIGAGLAANIGSRLRLSRENVRLIAPMGAAAGLAAAFNSPISAVLFVIEEVVGRWSSGVLGAVVMAAVSGAMVSRSFLGAEPMFRHVSFEFRGASELMAYAALGVAGGLAAGLFLVLVLWLRPRLKALPRWTQYLQPAIAGALIGLIGLRFPQVMGAGYSTITRAVRGEFIWQLLLALAIVKLLATAISFSSGAPGGLFAPALFMGVTLGSAIGGMEHHFFPRLAGTTAAFALVGVGTMFAGVLRAPMTSVFMVLEVSGNYDILLPVMVSNTIAFLISRTLLHEPLFDALSRQDGIDLPSLEARREAAELRIEDAMRPNLFPVLHSDELAAAAADRLRNSAHDFVWVQASTGAWYLMAQTAMQRAVGERRDVLLRDIVPEESLPEYHPDQPLEEALRHATVFPALPVLSRADGSRILGMLTLEDIMSAYRAQASTPSQVA